MYKRLSLRLTAALIMSSALVAPAAASVTVGTPSIGGNCFPFSCSYTGTYQQVYGASAFSGVTMINTVDFFAAAGFGALKSNLSSYTFSFYLTNLPVDGLTTNPALNRGTLLSSFGTFTPGTSYTFVGNSFTYNPALGNLLLDIQTAGSPNDFNAWSYSSTVGDQMSNMYRTSGTGPYATGSNGLVTRFSTTAVPEPSTWAMLLVGFFAIGAIARRSCRAEHAFPQLV